jgi:hypothetical protein
MFPLYATIEAFAADGYTHVECYCPRCRVIKVEADLFLIAVARKTQPRLSGCAIMQPPQGSHPGVTLTVLSLVLRGVSYHRSPNREALLFLLTSL